MTAQMEQYRSGRQAVYEKIFSARSLCAAGLSIMPAFLLNPSPLFRTVQFLFFWFFCWLSGRKNNPFITLIIILGIVIFNLLVPYGRVLFSFGAFKITAGALTAGIQRAVTLEGLIMLSRVCVRRDLRIPGVFGELIAESFRIFARIMESKQRISARNFVQDIDGLMLELSGEDDLPAGEHKPAQKTKAAGFIIIAMVVILSYAAGFCGYL